MSRAEKIGFSGSCHWCTEAVFQLLNGVISVKQGWVSTDGEATPSTEGVIVLFDPEVITLDNLVAVHLHTHSSTSEHPMRSKYRSAIYYFSSNQIQISREAIRRAQADFDRPIITSIMPFFDFRINDDRYLNYYVNNPNRPFCQTYIDPKLRLLLSRFSGQTKTRNLNHLVK